jgi:hypothetical protein
MGRSLRAVLVTFVFASVLCLASTAVAAVIPWASANITVLTESDGAAMLISCTLPETAKLPAEVELSAPAGSQLLWLGEIRSATGETDVELPYTTSTVGGADVYRVTLTKSRTAQLEVAAMGVQSVGGSDYTGTLQWVSAQKIPSVSLGVLVPPTAKITQEASGAAMYPADATHSIYGVIAQSVKPGQKFDLTFSYTVPAPTVPVGGGSGTNVLLVLVLGVVLIAGIAVIVFAVKTRTSSGGSDDDDDEGEDEDDEPVERGRASSASPQSRAAASPSKPTSGPSSGSGGGGKAKRNLITGGVLVLFLLAAAVVGVMVIQPKVVGDTISQTFAGGNPCTSFTVQVAPAQGADPSATANTIFAALKPLGIIDAVYNIKTNELVVGYCQDVQSEANILAALAPTQLVSPSAETTTP